MRRAVLLLSLGLAILAAVPLGAGCGGDKDTAPPAPREPAPSTTCPGDPVEALRWIRAAHIAPDDTELRLRLAAWPVDAPAFRETEETQVVLTWRMRVKLQDGDIEGAVATWHTLEERFDGHGVSPEGRGLTPDMVRLGLVEEARLLARRRIEGARGDRDEARSAYDLAMALLADDEEEDRARLEHTRRWFEGDTLASWTAPLGLTVGPALAKRGPPHVVVLADDFALGDELLTSVLMRWLREGEEVGMRGVIVPVLRGQVRMGLRRVPAPDEAAERASLADRAQAMGFVLEPDAGLFGGGAVDGRRLAATLGLEGQDVALFVLDGEGRIVARLSGQGLDPRGLDPVIQKLTSR
ncbi:MAG: hypothetical protein O2894_04790 [Planctomycetota bacterium]|nr:hypothetical protein [Planctomycetota bacterium]